MSRAKSKAFMQIQRLTKERVCDMMTEITKHCKLEWNDAWKFEEFDGSISKEAHI